MHQTNTRHNWVGKVIHWELSKRLKFNLTTKWHMHKPEASQANETHKIFWDFGIQTDHLYSARKPDFMLIIKKKELVIS